MTAHSEPELRFYEALAEVYDVLFPLAPQKVTFCKQYLETGHHELLDIGCATGALCFALAADGYHITGLDSDERMLQIARQKRNIEHQITFIADDMRNLNRRFPETSLDAVFCFGNTMAHLDGADEIEGFLDQVYKSLRPGGEFLGQLVNYERIISGRISELPLIQRGEVTFARRYRYEENDRSLMFEGRLILGKSRQTLQNRIRLYPLTMPELRSRLSEIGFKNIEFFGDFNCALYTGRAGALVFAAKK